MSVYIYQCAWLRFPPTPILERPLSSTIRKRFEGKIIDLSPYNRNFDLGKSRQIFHHSSKEHHKISNIPKFRCEML
jgi:hypothetical protein